MVMRFWDHPLYSIPYTFQTHKLPIQVTHQFVGVVTKSMGNRLT